MAKTNKIRRMETAPTSKARGRTARTTAPDASTPEAREGNVQIERRVEVNRPQSAGGGKNRGDRRDMSKTYSDTTKHAARGATPRRDVKTRKR